MASREPSQAPGEVPYWIGGIHQVCEANRPALRIEDERFVVSMFIYGPQQSTPHPRYVRDPFRLLLGRDDLGFQAPRRSDSAIATSATRKAVSQRVRTVRTVRTKTGIITATKIRRKTLPSEPQPPSGKPRESLRSSNREERSSGYFLPRQEQVP